MAAAISLTRDAIPELPDLADHLVEPGERARSRSVPSPALAARARWPRSAFDDASDRARLYLVAAALAAGAAADVRVDCDLAPAQGLWQRARGAMRALLGGCEGLRRGPPARRARQSARGHRHGRLKPIAYDFDARFDVASLEGLAPREPVELQGPGGFKVPLGRWRPREPPGSAGPRDWFDFCTRLSESQQPG